MKNFLTTSFLLFVACALYSGEIKLDGVYQGENLYVMNPFASNGVGFCVYEVTVNGQTTTDEINSSAFEVDLGFFNFRRGDNLSVVIKSKEDCNPKILNAEVLLPKASFDILSMNFEDGKLVWETRNEIGSLPYRIEQFRWNKWVKVGEVKGKGGRDNNQYEFSVRLHSGENRFRLRQMDSTGETRASEDHFVQSDKPEVTYTPTNRVDDQIVFSAPTLYEIYNEYGNIVFKGYGEKLDVSGLSRGKYYLNFDNSMDTFVKK